MRAARCYRFPHMAVTHPIAHSYPCTLLEVMLSNLGHQIHIARIGGEIEIDAADSKQERLQTI